MKKVINFERRDVVLALFIHYQLIVDNVYTYSLFFFYMFINII